MASVASAAAGAAAGCLVRGAGCEPRSRQRRAAGFHLSGGRPPTPAFAATFAAANGLAELGPASRSSSLFGGGGVLADAMGTEDRGPWPPGPMALRPAGCSTSVEPNRMLRHVVLLAVPGEPEAGRKPHFSHTFLQLHDPVGSADT